MVIRYRKLAKIDSGGFGVVYRATRVDDSSVVALKELADGHSDDDAKRFRREVRLQARLKHKNIVPILAANLEATPPWFAMPLASDNLSSRIPDIAGNVPMALKIFGEILDGVEYAHKNGVLHRDLKPQNILFLPDLAGGERACIGDLGLGRLVNRDTTTLTTTSMTFGTPAYSPPEQFECAKEADERADIFSLGKILYQMITGRFPMYVDLQAMPAGGFMWIVEKCCEHDPRKRYRSVAALRSDLELLAVGPSNFEPPMTRAKEVLNEILAGDFSAQALAELNRLFRQNPEDEQLYTEILPYLPEPIIDQYMSQMSEQFLQVLRTFDDRVAGILPFSYTDVVADFYERVFVRITDASTRRMMLARLLLMGASHNRWHVGEVFGRLAGKIHEPSEVLALRGLLHENAGAAAFVARYVLRNSPAAAIRVVVNEVQAESQARQPAVGDDGDVDF